MMEVGRVYGLFKSQDVDGDNHQDIQHLGMAVAARIFIRTSPTYI